MVVGMILSALVPRDDGEVVSLAAALERVVLPQGVGGELLGHHKTPQRLNG